MAVGSNYSTTQYINFIFLKNRNMSWSYCWILFAPRLNFCLLTFMLIYLYSQYPSKYLIFDKFTWQIFIASFFITTWSTFLKNTCNDFMTPSAKMEINWLSRSRPGFNKMHLDNNIFYYNWKVVASILEKWTDKANF